MSVFEAKTYADSGYLGAFKTKAKKWALEVVKLFNTPVPKELQADKGKLLKSASFIKKGVEGIFGTMEELENVGLSFLPLLIPLAVVAASLAAIYKWNRDYATFKKKLAYHKTLVDKGLSPARASAAVKSVSKPALIDFDAKMILPVAVLGGGLWWLYNQRGRR